jgi:hypothetical protein
MKKDPHDLERLNKMISPYQGPGWAATSRPEKERMLRAQSCKRRQIRRAEAPIDALHVWAYVIFCVFLAGILIVELGGM